MVISENTEKIAGGRHMARRYADTIKPKEKKEKVSGTQIAGDLIGRIAKVK